VANVIYLLLQQRAKGEQHGDEHAHDAKKLQFDLNVSRNNQAKIKEQLRVREEECKKLSKHADEAAFKAGHDRAALVQQRDAAVAEKIDLKRRDSQMQHAARKMEQQCEKLQVRICVCVCVCVCVCGVCVCVCVCVCVLCVCYAHTVRC